MLLSKETSSLVELGTAASLSFPCGGVVGGISSTSSPTILVWPLSGFYFIHVVMQNIYTLNRIYSHDPFIQRSILQNILKGE